ncbi:glycosyltransferase [Flexibacterium corallicola]|uniref:glycosyltransferase n=1 Tax=Flexibacterium corallicola TaxID=3037259 RepID=UPI00286F4A3B|nr:glycosyltransferase [Pseudovibrio sp. M1P-2-3]
MKISKRKITGLKGRETYISLVTSSAYPWRTGTSINTLWRAKSLSDHGYTVTLYLPWLEETDQKHAFQNGEIFKTQEEQTDLIRKFMEIEELNFELKYYPAYFHRTYKSIFTNAPFRRVIEKCDYLLVEDVDHLQAFNPLDNYRKLAGVAVGILHTNYSQYIASNRKQKGIVPLWFIQTYLRISLLRHCDAVVALSSALYKVFREAAVVPINGIPQRFFLENTPTKKSAYFCGKLIKEKGLFDLLDLVSHLPFKLDLDLYGIEGNLAALTDYAAHKNLEFSYKGITAQPHVDLAAYKIFINPSKSEVFCTTTAEALAMGKFVIIPRHKSNLYFCKFKNCLTYVSTREFVEVVTYALNHEPEQDAHLVDLSWEKATGRLLDFLRTVKRR